nr:LOG family protein [Angustibacter aerolatus]
MSGGGRVSMMGAVARAVRAGGGRTTGVIPQALVDLEVADTGADDLLVVSDMRARKGLMDARSDAFVVLPGGVGTLEEPARGVDVALARHARQAGRRARPVGRPGRSAVAGRRARRAGVRAPRGRRPPGLDDGRRRRARRRGARAAPRRGCRRAVTRCGA